MARMLGRWRSGGCGCNEPGPDCAGHERDTRARKRQEAREWREAEGWQPFFDEARAGECRHGCNGAEIMYGYASDTCDWQCHPGLKLNPERAARFDAVTEQLTAAAGNPDFHPAYRFR